MEDFSPADGQYVNGKESIHPAYPFRVTARDLARFGLLMLRRGEWNGRRIVDAAWVEECTRYHSDAALYSTDGYGYNVVGGTRAQHVPASARRAHSQGSFSARGAGGHHVLIIPAYDLVIVHRVNTDIRGNQVSSAEFGRLVQLLLDARMPAPERACLIVRQAQGP